MIAVLSLIENCDVIFDPSPGHGSHICPDLAIPVIDISLIGDADVGQMTSCKQKPGLDSVDRTDQVFFVGFGKDWGVGRGPGVGFLVVDEGIGSPF